MFTKVLLTVLATVSVCNALAQPVPKLNSISREWIQRGSSIQLTLSGENLADAKGILIDGAPGLDASIVPAEVPRIQVESSRGGVSSVVPQDGKSLSIKLSVLPEAALTERELRVMSPSGVSNPLTVRISHLPETDSAPSNNSMENAQAISLPAAIMGVISAGGESDFYRFAARKGEHIVFDLHAFRLGGSPLDSSIAILDKKGQELARNEDAVGLDSILDFTAPEDGEYILQVRDFRYQGSGNHRYRLIAGSIPHAFTFFPFGGKRGENVEVELKGPNLEGASRLVLNLAPDAPLGRQEIRATTGKGISSAFPFDVTDLPQYFEREPNTALDQADVVQLPGSINGKINKERDYDAFRFTASKDQNLIFEVHAYRFSSPLDALLTITDSVGNILQRNDDAAGTDARIDFRFPADGEYFLVLEDLLGRGGENFGYRITATVPQPDFSLVFLPDAPRLRRGGRVPVRVELNRANGFGDAVLVSAQGLPPGLHAEPLLLSQSSPGSGYLMLTASADAPLGSFPLKLVGSGTINGKVVKRQAGSGTKGAYLTVLDSAPFAIASATLMANIEQNQAGAIEAVVERKNGFNGEIRITAEGFSAAREPITKSFDLQPLVLKPGETRGALTLKAKLESEIGTRPIFLKAESDIYSDYSAQIPLATREIPFVLTTTLKKLIVTALPSSSTSAAREAVFNVKAERRGGFAGEINLVLEGVPEGITPLIDKIPANAGEVTVKLTASEKAPTGKDFQLTITGTGVHNDRTHRFQPAPITLTVNAPEPVEEKQPKLAGSN